MTARGRMTRGAGQNGRNTQGLQNGEKCDKMEKERISQDFHALVLKT